MSRNKFTVRDARKDRSDAYKPSPFSHVFRWELDKLESHTRSIADYLLGLYIAFFVLTCCVAVLIWFTVRWFA